MVEFHPLADAFPLMEGDDFEELVKDIEANGQRHPIMRFEGKILDGRNRYRACQRLGVKARMQEFFGGDPVAFVVSENITRRHLTPAQRALAAEKLATAMQGRPRTKSPAGTEPEHHTTIAEAAELMDASPTSVKRVRKVRKAAVPEVVEAMDAGEISPTAAENLARLPEDKQSEIMSNGDPKVIAETASKEAKSVPGPGRGKVGPHVTLTRQMGLPDFDVVQGVADDWNEHRAVIPELDDAAVAAFLVRLKATRTSLTRMINLIEHGDVRGTLAKSAALKASSDKAHGKDGDKAPAKPRKAAPRKAPRKAPAKATVTDLAAKRADKAEGTGK